MEHEKNFVLSRIQQLLNERDWTIYKLAKESGMAYSSLNNIFVRNTIPSVITLEKICDGLQITLSQFFDINMPVTENIDFLTSDERTIISMYRELDRNSKELLKAYLMGLSRKLPENFD
ncbi:MAG: helix-turn-helix domain-containing protein [Ruminococcus sp.]